VAFWQCPWAQQSEVSSTAFPLMMGKEGRGREGLLFKIFMSWFLHVVLSALHPSTAAAQNSEPCGDCWLTFIQQHVLLTHLLLLLFWASRVIS